MISYTDISLQIISYSSQAAYNCYLLPNGVTEQTRRHASGMTSSLPKFPFRRKNFTDISYTDRVIANFVPNFVAMATRSMGENAVGSIQWPIPENPPIDAKISQISFTQAEL